MPDRVCNPSCRTGFATPSEIFCPHAGVPPHAGRGLQPLMPDGVCNPSCRTGFATPSETFCPHAGVPKSNLHAGRGLQPRPKHFVLMPGFPKAICKIALHAGVPKSNLQNCSTCRGPESNLQNCSTCRGCSASLQNCSASLFEMSDQQKNGNQF